MLRLHEEEITTQLWSLSVELNSENITLDSVWTKRMKEKLGQVAERGGFKVCTSGFPDCYEREWLYDMVWYTETEKKLLQAVPLVAEFEWNKYLSHVKYDFEKLLLANSNLRLMVCQCWPATKDEWWRFFDESIRANKTCRNQDRFLIAIYDNSLKAFEFKLIVKGNHLDISCHRISIFSNLLSNGADISYRLQIEDNAYA